MLNEIEKRDAVSEVKQMLENDCYNLIEAVNHIAKCYEVNPFQLGLWYKDYNKEV